MRDHRISIPRHIVYRIYGDDLAVVMNVKSRATLPLQNEALSLWSKLAADPQGQPEVHERPVYEQLIEAGMIETSGEFWRRSPSSMNVGAAVKSSELIRV